MTAQHRSIEDVAGALAAQKAALLCGRLDALDGLARDLEAALKRLARASPDPEQLGGLRRSAAQNAQLLDAAQRGLSQAADMRRPSRPDCLTTYDVKGRQSPAGVASGHLLSRG